MNTLIIDLDELKTPTEILKLFGDNHLKEGDAIKILTNFKKNELVIFAVVTVVVNVVLKYMQKQNRQYEGEKILLDVIQSKSVEELEQELMEDYNIVLSVETKNDYWKEHSITHFLSAYSNEMEPEYTDADIKEPNVEYKKI
jgi:hypothetical protein